MNSTRKHMRYGKCRLRDIWIYWVSAILLLIALMCNIIIGKQYSVSIVAFVILFIMYALYFRKYFECFELDGRHIVTSSERIDIPNDVYLLFSITQIRIIEGGAQQFLKHKISVSIITSSNISADLQMLHKNCRYLYSNLSIADVFKSRFIYSFVYDPEIVNQIINSCNATLVIPESLKKDIDFDENCTNILIDADR